MSKWMNSALKSLVNGFSLSAFIAWWFVFMSFSLVILEAPRRQKSRVPTYSHPASALCPEGAPECYFLMNGASHTVKCVLTWDQDSGCQGLFVKPMPYYVKDLPASQGQGDQEGVTTVPLHGSHRDSQIRCLVLRALSWGPHAAINHLQDLGQVSHP